MVVDILVNDSTSIDEISSIINNPEELWLETSYDHNIRKNYARVGYLYRDDLDAFIAPKPFDSWTLNENTCKWLPPIPYPQDGMVYEWNEELLSWTEPAK